MTLEHNNCASDFKADATRGIRTENLETIYGNQDRKKRWNVRRATSKKNEACAGHHNNPTAGETHKHCGLYVTRNGKKMINFPYKYLAEAFTVY